MALRSGAAVLVLVGAVSVAASAQRPASVVFDRVTVVDVEQGKLVPDQRVVITGNRIQAVGGSRAVSLPKGAQVVDARGKYLIPGLWDLHVHTTAYVPYPLLIANGVTGMRDGWSYVPLDTMVQWWREILAGTRVGPPRQLLTGDQKELHQGATNKLTESELLSRKARGANFIKLYPYTPAAASLVRRVGLPFGGHIDDASPGTGMWKPGSVSEASDSGISIVDHWNVAYELVKLCWGSTVSSDRVAQCQPLADRLLKNGTWFVPTVLAFASEAELKTAGQKGPAYLLAAKRFQERSSEFWAGPLLHGNWLRDSTQVDSTRVQRRMRVLQRTGMPMLAGSDTDLGPPGMQQRAPGFALHAELAGFVAEGLTPAEALRTATLNPAKMLRGTDSLGTVAPGKLADLVLLDADPLADITNTTTIRAVVANGRYFDRAALDQLMAKVKAEVKEKYKYWGNEGERYATTADGSP